MQTISQKEDELKNTVALVDNNDFQLLVGDSDSIEKIINDLNEGLTNILIDIKAASTTLGEIGSKISNFMKLMTIKYPEVGLGDSEAYEAVARYFSINYAPYTYDYIRYKIQWSQN
ncbi:MULTISPECIES: hypothetical protein [unclassified Pseudoalteromonas]|uniref:hypothetical protein n=1 Tax=unclassified Pseudoalteromonas TaxID=194690 RepID=UPI0005A7A28D|nr:MULTISPECIES: hypothetical protein [unclassified Pseudoalteromonas]